MSDCPMCDHWRKQLSEQDAKIIAIEELDSTAQELRSIVWAQEKAIYELQQQNDYYRSMLAEANKIIKEGL
jgi:inorganic pyrophosphatase